MNPEQFAEILAAHGIELNDTQKEQFGIYYRTLVQWNKKMNLTRLTAESDVYLKHFYDSVTAAFYADFYNHLQMCDIGAGAGFPSLPLKICFPDISVTIVDSLQKRIGFLKQLSQDLGLNRVSFYHDRAESFGKNQQFREQFDVVTARAVARMSVLSELCLPLIKQNGVFLAMKGSKAQDELHQAQNAIKQLGGSLNDVHSFHLPNEESERSIVIIDKKQHTPKKYPRKPGTPNQSPL